MTKITSFIIDGKEYASVDEMPADVRKSYEERIAKHNAPGAEQRKAISAYLSSDGAVFPSAEDLPEEVRPLYEQAIRTIDSNGDGKIGRQELLKFAAKGALRGKFDVQLGAASGADKQPHPAFTKTSGASAMLRGAMIVAALAGYYFLTR